MPFKVFLPYVVLTVLFAVGGFSIDANGRVAQAPTQVYDAGYGVLSSDYAMDIGTVTIPEGKQVRGIYISGTMTSTQGLLWGTYFELNNISPVGDVGTDLTRVRGIGGQVATTGPGSVRGIHTTAIGTAGSTGMVNAANFQVQPASTTTRASSVQLSNTGYAGIADGIFYGGSSSYRFGINMAEFGAFSDASIYIPMGEASAIRWTNGARLFMDTDNQLKLKYVNGTIRILASPQ